MPTRSRGALQNLPSAAGPRRGTSVAAPRAGARAPGGADLEALDSSRERGVRITVFTPSPIFTVTIEGAGRGGCEVHFHAGGQGFWVARMAVALGAHATLCGPFSGESGRVLRGLIEAEGVAVRAIEAAAANGGYVHDRREGERRTVAEMPSAELSRHELDDLYDATLTTGLASRVAVLTGPRTPAVVGADVYRRLALDFAEHGVRVVADLSGAALDALAGGVELLKVADDELVAAGLAADAEPGSLVRAAEALRARGAANVVVSRADRPAIALVGERWLELRPPKLHPADHRGAGDSMTAAIAAAFARELPVEDALRLGGAAGALNVTRHGLATGTRSDVESLVGRVEIRAFAP